MADAGWKLIGTMVAEPAEKSIAVIRYLRTQIQDTVKEGDRAGGLRIKKIMRDRILVGTGDNEIMIAMNRTLPTDGLERSRSVRCSRPATAGTPSDAYTASIDHSMNPMRPTGRSRFLHLDRQVVEVSLADPDQVLQHVAIKPASHTDTHPEFGSPPSKREVFSPTWACKAPM